MKKTEEFKTRKNEWVEFLKGHVGKTARVFWENGTSIEGKIKCINHQHSNFVLDTPEEHVVLRGGWLYISIPRTKKK